MANTSNSNPNNGDNFDAGNGQNPNGDTAIYYLSPAEALHSHVLEIATGTNILESITDYVQRRNLGVTVLSGSGFVTNVTLHHPDLPDGVLTLDGRFPIMHLSGTIVPSPQGFSRLNINLGRGEGQMVACCVAGTILVASGPVTVNAVTFTCVVYDRLSLEEDGANGGERQSQPASSASVEPPASSASVDPLASSARRVSFV